MSWYCYLEINKESIPEEFIGNDDIIRDFGDTCAIKTQDKVSAAALVASAIKLGVSAFVGETLSF